MTAYDELRALPEEQRVKVMIAVIRQQDNNFVRYSDLRVEMDDEANIVLKGSVSESRLRDILPDGVIINEAVIQLYTGANFRLLGITSNDVVYRDARLFNPASLKSMKEALVSMLRQHKISKVI